MQSNITPDRLPSNWKGEDGSQTTDHGTDYTFTYDMSSPKLYPKSMKSLSFQFLGNLGTDGTS